MRPTLKLRRLRQNCTQQLARLEVLVDSVGIASEPAERRVLSYVVIETDNLVVGALRNFTKSSLMGCETASGKVVTTNTLAANSKQAGALILRTLRNKKFNDLGKPLEIEERVEPTYRQPSDGEKVLLAYGANNLHRLQSGMAINARVFSELKHVRNFFAHRCANTNEAARKLAQQMQILDYTTAEDLVLRRRPENGVPLLKGWLAELKLFFELAF